MNPAKSKHCHWNQVYVFRGSTEGVRVQTLNGLIDFLCPFFHGQNALFSHLHSLLCVLCVLRVLPCILYLRVLSRCHPATPPCSSAVREQPGQVWNGRRMRNLMASRQVSSLPTSRWECWGVSPELTVGFSFSLYWSSASTCASNSRMLGDVSLPGRFRNQLYPALHMYCTCT